MSEQNLDLSIDINQILKTLSFKKITLSMAIIIGVFGTFTPLLFKGLDKESKTLLLLSGVMGFSTASLLPRNTKDEKIHKFWSDVVQKNYAKQLQHEVVRSNAQTEIREKNLLAKFIDDDTKVPEFQKPYWAKKFGVMELITSFFISSEEVEKPALESWQTTTPITHTVQKVNTSPEMDWIVQIAKKSTLPIEKRSNQHFKIDGGSQSGKSTLISLLISLINQMEGEMDINLTDPKHPKTTWKIPPSFVGFEEVSSGVSAAIDELERRKKLCIEADKNGQKQPDFRRYLKVLDEWDTTWGNGKGYGDVIGKPKAEKIKGQLQRLFQESAAYNMSLILIGQSPLAANHGFTQSVFNSTTRIILGNEALKFVQSPTFPFKDKSAGLASELQKIIESGDRVALVIPNMGMPFVEAIPQIDLKKIFNQDVEPSQLTDTQTDFINLKNWVENNQPTPTHIEIKTRWEKMTGKILNDAGLQYLLGKLGL